jgi:hypothetical protein
LLNGWINIDFGKNIWVIGKIMIQSGKINCHSGKNIMLNGKAVSFTGDFFDRD